MIQELIIYILLALATTYVGYRIYSSIKKKQACGKCVLIDEAKKNRHTIMMKILHLFILINLFGLNSFSQSPTWDWAKKSTGIVSGYLAQDIAYDIATDSLGNTYTTGCFQSGSLVLGAFTLPNTNPSYYDIFLAKYDSNGNTLWAISAGGSNDDKGHGVAVARSGNVYITGEIGSSSVTFGSTTLSGIYISGNAFIAKYDNNGNFIWVQVYSDWYGGNEIGYDIALDENENIFITGIFDGTFYRLGTDTLANSNDGTQDIFVAKFDSSGNPIWAKSSGGIYDDYSNSVAVDTMGNCYITGRYRNSSISFDSITLTNTGFDNFFIAKFNPQGLTQWAKNSVGSSVQMGVSTGTDEIGNVYVTGSFSSPTITFGSYSLNLTGALNYDIFLVKYDTNGNVLWAKSAGGTSNDFAYCIAVDKNGDSYISGTFMGNFVISSTTLSAFASKDVYIAKHDNNGNMMWAKGFGGNSIEECNGISVDKNGNLFTTGTFGSSSIIFDAITLIKTGFYDVFISKLSPIYTSISTFQPANTIFISPNPFNSYTLISFEEEQKNSIIKIVDELGRKIKEIKFTGNQFTLEKGEIQAGIYFVQITDIQKNIINKKIIIQ